MYAHQKYPPTPQFPRSENLEIRLIIPKLSILLLIKASLKTHQAPALALKTLHLHTLHEEELGRLHGKGTEARVSIIPNPYEPFFLILEVKGGESEEEKDGCP